MQIGIPFFDTRALAPGDLWVVAGLPGSGKSTLLRNLALGLARNLDSHLVFWHLEEGAPMWRRKIESMGHGFPPNLLQRNDGTTARSIANLLEEVSVKAGVVLIDSFELFVPKQDREEAFRRLKSWLVRSQKVAIVSAHMRPSDSFFFFPFSDAVFACAQTSANRLTVHVEKLRKGPVSGEFSFSWDHGTGVLS